LELRTAPSRREGTKSQELPEKDRLQQKRRGESSFTCKKRACRGGIRKSFEAREAANFEHGPIKSCPGGERNTLGG